MCFVVERTSCRVEEMKAQTKSLIFRCFLISALVGLFHLVVYSFIKSSKLSNANISKQSLLELIGDIRKVETQPPRCNRERINMVYIKTHKTASDTTTNILHRFGLRRKLAFVQPVHKHMHLCFPYLLEPYCFRPLKTKQFNIMCQHVVYTPEVMSRIMPPDTVYFTTIREPFARAKSSFAYFHMHDRARNLIGGNRFERYLEDIPRNERRIKSPDNFNARGTSCLPLGYSDTLNGMAFDLGFPTGFHYDTVDQSQNATFIREWMMALSRQFSLVMVVEYFHESLVLLRRLMCWTTEDIIYLKQNERKYINKNNSTNPKLIANFRRYNVPDYVLYDHFNRTLWRKIADAGDDFWAEVEHFNGVIATIAQFCHASPTVGGSTLVIPKSPWNGEFTLQRGYCVKMEKLVYADVVRLYESLPGKITESKLFVPGC